MDISASDAQLDALAASSIVVCPTLGGFTPELIRMSPPLMQELLRAAGGTPEQVVALRHALLGRMEARGVSFVGGADAGIAPPKAHGAYAESVLELASVIGTVASLVASTSTAARVCGLAADRGRLAPGHVADVVVASGDLETELAGLRDVLLVVLRGTVR